MWWTRRSWPAARRDRFSHVEFYKHSSRLKRQLLLVVFMCFVLWSYIERTVPVFPKRDSREIVHKYLITQMNQGQIWRYGDNVTGFSSPIVPNCVHFVKFGNHRLSFSELVVLLAAFCHQQPERIIIHCDCDELKGKYWKRVKQLPGIKVRRIALPKSVFGQKLDTDYLMWHAGDVARINVLSKYGGIALDFDTYVVRSLDYFRRFECTVGWDSSEDYFGCQIIVAHKESRFIHLYKESYRYYRGDKWYYNAGELPTHIIRLMPHLVHRVPRKFGVKYHFNEELYKSYWPQWREFYAIHLVMRHRAILDPYAKAIDFNEENIRLYPFTYGEMARLVLFGDSKYVIDNRTIDWKFSHCRR